MRKCTADFWCQLTSSSLRGRISSSRIWKSIISAFSLSIFLPREGGFVVLLYKWASPLHKRYLCVHVGGDIETAPWERYWVTVHVDVFIIVVFVSNLRFRHLFVVLLCKFASLCTGCSKKSRWHDNWLRRRWVCANEKKTLSHMIVAPYISPLILAGRTKTNNNYIKYNGRIRKRWKGRKRSWS